MAALPNIGGALCVQRRKVWLTPNTGVPCSNAAKTRNPMKLAGVPQTTGSISAASGPKLTILRGLWRRYCCLTIFFSDVDTCLSCEDMVRQICAMVPRWRLFGEFLGPAFPASSVQHISDLHSKCALGPYHVSKYYRHPFCNR